MAEHERRMSVFRDFDGMTVEEIRRSLDGLPDWAVARTFEYGNGDICFAWIEKEVGR